MSVEGGEFSKRLSSFVGNDSHGYVGPPKSHIVIFTMAYVFFGLVVCMMRLGCYQQWPLFMKKAVAHSGDHHTGWMGREREKGVHDHGDGTWVELDGVEVHDAFSKATKHDETDKVTVPKSVHFTTVTVEAVDVENDKDLERGPDNQGVQGSARDEHQDMHANCSSVRQMRKSGLLVVGLAMFLLLVFWPIQVIWVLVWWAIFKVWATHYIYISTRRSRAVGRAHSGHVDSQSSKPVIVVQKTTFVMESPGREAQLEKNSGGNTTTVTAGHRETNNPWSTGMTNAGFNNFFPPAGKIPRKVKAFLQHEPFLPAPEYCRRKMRDAEKKRRDLLESVAVRLLVRQQLHRHVKMAAEARRMLAESEETSQRCGSFITEMTKANQMSRENMAAV